ncbi:TadE family protein [Bremerella sp. JC817]|uniref:TadE/TadG family type IV pilus assembly protein n=1 Tax=Bremerella sp. JC817 TaxID=3231756 RepID=UPI00345786F5
MWRTRPQSRRVSRFLHDKKGKRTGATIVETALVMPVFFMFVFAIIEFGHATMINNVLKNACRTAARWGSATGATTAQVEQYARDRMGGAVNPAMVNIQIKDASMFDTGGDAPKTNADFQAMPDIELKNAEPRQMFMVRASIPYGEVSLIPQPWLGGVTLSGQTFTRHE